MKSKKEIIKRIEQIEHQRDTIGQDYHNATGYVSRLQELEWVLSR